MRQIEKKLSEEFGLSREEIHKIIMFSYAETSRQMKGSGTTYELTGLGTFSIIPKNANKLKNRLIELLPEDKVRSPEIIEILNNKLND